MDIGLGFGGSLDETAPGAVLDGSKACDFQLSPILLVMAVAVPVDESLAGCHLPLAAPSEGLMEHAWSGAEHTIPAHPSLFLPVVSFPCPSLPPFPFPGWCPCLFRLRRSCVSRGVLVGVLASLPFPSLPPC